MKIIGIIQARLDSKRLPNKMLEQIGSLSLIEHVFKQISKIRFIDSVIVAIPDNIENNILADLLLKQNIPFYRGHSNDVLTRFCQFPKIEEYDYVVRITGDCPFISIELADELIQKTITYNYCYGKIIDNFVPVGSRISLLSVPTLYFISKVAKHDLYREHLTLYLDEHFDSKKMLAYKPSNKYYEPDIRITIDTNEDLQTIRNLYSFFNSSPSIEQIIELYKNQQELFTNRKIIQNRPVVKK